MYSLAPAGRATSQKHLDDSANGKRGDSSTCAGLYQWMRGSFVKSGQQILLRDGHHLVTLARGTVLETTAKRQDPEVPTPARRTRQCLRQFSFRPRGNLHERRRPVSPSRRGRKGR